jgi:membrane protease YdiL (CAAX protease family)
MMVSAAALPRPSWWARWSEPTPLYLGLSFFLAAVAWIGLRLFDAPQVMATALAMTAPTLATLVAGVSTGLLPTSLRPLLALIGRAYRPSWHALYGVLLISAVVAVGIPLSYALGAAGSGTLTLAAWTPGVIVAGLVITFVPACAEEFGWRGFLLDRLIFLHPATAAALIGLLWGLWHAPAIAGSGFDYGVHRLAGVIAMCLVTVPFSIVLAWLRRRSGSLFAPALAHATFNALVGPLVIAGTHSNPLLAAPMGLLGALPMAGLAAVIVTTGALGAAPGGAPTREIHKLAQTT